MIKKELNLRQQVIYRDAEADRYYRRLAGGLGWPEKDKPGWLVVVAEGLRRDEGLKGHPLYVVGERECANIEDLHRGCRELRAQLACEVWLADLENKGAKRLFLRGNEELGEAGRVWLRAGAYSASGKLKGLAHLQVIAHLLDTVSREERKVLNFGESRLPGMLASLEPQQLGEDLSGWPALAALGYAVAELVLRQPREQSKGPAVVFETVPANWR